jgi:hypothetical protein
MIRYIVYFKIYCYFCFCMITLLIKEIRSFLSSLIGYIAIGVFITGIGTFMWLVPTESAGSNVLENGFANIDPLFILAPWVYLVLNTSYHHAKLFGREKNRHHRTYY